MSGTQCFGLMWSMWWAMACAVKTVYLNLLTSKKRGKSRRVWELTPSHPCNAKLGQGCSELSVDHRLTSGVARGPGPLQCAKADMPSR